MPTVTLVAFTITPQKFGYYIRIFLKNPILMKLSEVVVPMCITFSPTFLKIREKFLLI